MADPIRPLTARVDAHASPGSPPKRRFRLVLDLHADTLDDLARELESIAFDVRCGDDLTARTSGAPNAGYQAELTDHGDPLTHDAYIAALREWRSRVKGDTGTPLGVDEIAARSWPKGQSHG